MKRSLAHTVIYKPHFDGLRAIAIILTILAHTNYLRSYSVYGVDIFFVLSGYFISQVFLEKKLSPREFLLNRFARLYPLILLYAIVALLFSLRFKTPGAFGGALASIFAIKNFQGGDSLFAHFWSLSAEFQFYVLVWGIVISWNHETVYRFLKPICCLMLVNVLFLEQFFSFASTDEFSKYNQILSRPSEIWLGIMAFKLRQHDKFLKFYIYAVFFAICLFVFIVTKNPFFLSLAIFFLILYLDIKSKTIVGSILSFSFLRTIGVLSYSIYVWHFLIINVYEVSYIHLYRVFPEYTLNELLLIAVSSFILGYFSYTRFEMPLKSLICHRFARKGDLA